jgi:hypothetical protein
VLLPQSPFFLHYDIDLGSSFGRITPDLLTIRKLARRRAVQYVNCESCGVTSRVLRLEEFLLIVSGIANEMKSREYGHSEVASFAFGPVHV